MVSSPSRSDQVRAEPAPNPSAGEGKAVRLQLSRKKGFDLQAHSRAVNGLPAVVVARPGPWGNPFVVGRHGTRYECVAMFEQMASGLIALGFGKDCACAQMAYRKQAAEHLTALQGHNLACWCSLPREGEQDVCHAAVLIQWASEQPLALASRPVSDTPDGAEGTR